MLQPRERPAYCPGRLQGMFVRACAVTLLVCLLLYVTTLSDVHNRTVQSIESLNISTMLHSAVHKLQSAMKSPKVQRKRKLVLLWTDYFSSRGEWLPSTQEMSCPVSECKVTSNRSLLTNSSAVILHWRNIDAGDLPPECAKPKSEEQCPLWVLFNKEAPPHTPLPTLEAVQGKVHWTVTYRRDSDVFAPYGKVVPRPMRQSVKPDSDPSDKQHLLCWLVSNCDTPSKRELFVEELRKHVNVTTYGGCGKDKCPHVLASECYKWMSKRCTFYLSLENSLCRDYTTEKLYHALATDMVPVVMGMASHGNYEHLPPRSYVNTEDFSGPKALAEYLMRVRKDRSLYRSYFKWKRDYEVKDQSYLWYCELCERLHGVKAHDVRPRKDLVSWWFDEAKCTEWKMPS